MTFFRFSSSFWFRTLKTNHLMQSSKRVLIQEAHDLFQLQHSRLFVPACGIFNSKLFFRIASAPVEMRSWNIMKLPHLDPSFFLYLVFTKDTKALWRSPSLRAHPRQHLEIESWDHIQNESQTKEPHRLILPPLPKAWIFSPRSSRLPGACLVGLVAWRSDSVDRNEIPGKASESLLVGVFKPK